ncbi:MAG: DUF3536 domain-containing protein, partial [Spirochaetales bacterium]|nr:DUF3536 domain-containing protein [Spirochaetales bacterium]
TPLLRPETGLAADGQDDYERITAECYCPNSASRILDGNGKIAEILNNYQYISYDFDPTLLGWLKAERPNVYKRIIEADKISVGLHNGHGNAMAQIYSHLILPLSSFEDRKTMIIWGLRNFEYHFGRKSEGMWLPEAAIDYQTIDLLIENGVKFVILSSDQAKACRRINDDENGDKSWYVFDEDNYIDTNAAYAIRRAHGEIAVFFYNKAISDAVSFEHLLRDADALADRILNVKPAKENIDEPSENDNNTQDKPKKSQCVKVTDDTLVTIAADGKVFGHYEPFADMCLSGLITKYGIDSDQIRFMNPAEYLSECPPEFEILLRIGDDNLGSSWSCPHGVGRWYRDCGCRSGNDSHNQEWRMPMRDALNLVKNEADEIFLRYADSLTDNPNAVRNEYIDFVDNGYDMSHIACITDHAKRQLTENEITDMLQLLEAQRCYLMSFNSDGWNGSDITDTAAIWNLSYAHRTLNILEYYGSKIRLLFEEKLFEAKSNIVKYDNGREILKYFVYDSAAGYEFIINNMLAVYRLQKCIDKSQFRLFSLYNFDSITVESVDGCSDLYYGEVVISDRRTVIRSKWTFIYQIVSAKSYRLFISDESHSDLLLGQTDFIAKGGNAVCEGCSLLTENDLHPEIKSFVLNNRYRSYIQTLMNQNIANYGDVRMLVNAYKTLGMDLPDYLQSQLVVCADAFIRDISQKLTTFPTVDEYHLLNEIFSLLDYYHLKPHCRMLEERFSTILIEQLSSSQDILSLPYSDVVIMLQFCGRTGLQIDRTSVE